MSGRNWLSAMVGPMVFAGASLLSVSLAVDTGLGSSKVLGAAPDFTLADQDGNPVTLGTVVKAHRGVIVAFYPKDDTPG